jgi:putative ABC transport system permease protein
VSPLVQVGPELAVALVLLVALACGLGAYGRLCLQRDVLVACVRATAQLGLIALVLAGVVRSLGLSLGFVLVMTTVAGGTAARRLTRSPSGWWCVVPVACASLPVVSLLVLLDVVPARGVAVVPVAGILIGGAMTATVLAGRRGLDDLAGRRGEVEAAMALGFLDREARLMVTRPAGAEALLPGLDSTRTVGLVALPGTFVGTLLGGASPVQAGAVQLLVLVALLAVQAAAVVMTVELLARATLRRPPDDELRPARARRRPGAGGAGRSRAGRGAPAG